ncbi:MAG TPA: hypothetical protein VHA56_16250 [Mucilaginibacter sp.]|nr:hypothetical protein [Mucilaginibacter sp.]
MKKHYKFKVDQLVKLWDSFTDSWHYGHVIAFANGAVTIRWYDRSEATYRHGEGVNIWNDLEVCRNIR